MLLSLWDRHGNPSCSPCHVMSKEEGPCGLSLFKQRFWNSWFYSTSLKIAGNNLNSSVPAELVLAAAAAAHLFSFSFKLKEQSSISPKLCSYTGFLQDLYDCTGLFEVKLKEKQTNMLLCCVEQPAQKEKWWTGPWVHSFSAFLSSKSYLIITGPEASVAQRGPRITLEFIRKLYCKMLQQNKAAQIWEPFVGKYH